MKVKALITAAGMGRRFGALTRRTNKCLLKVEGKPLVCHILDKLRARRVTEVYLISGYGSRDVERVVDGRASVVFNPFYRVSGILGSFWAARPHLDGKAFLFTTADHFFHPSVLQGCLRGTTDLRIVVQRKKRYTKEDAKVTIRASEVTRLGKDLPSLDADGEFCGMVYFSPKASRLFFRELQSQFEKGDLGGYMMDILKVLRQKYSLPIRYSLCAENMRIEIDSVHDLIAARRLAKLFKGGKTR